VNCETGKFSVGGATECQDCPANFNCPRQNSLSRCPIYHYSLLGEEECSPCPPGKTCQHPNETAPVKCEDGYYADTLDWYC